MPHPFLKWAGGKTQLLSEIQKYYPQKIERYCEPFVGGGAVLFDVIEKFNPQEILINDINPELTNCYKQIKNNVADLIDVLSEWQNDYLIADEENLRAVSKSLQMVQITTGDYSQTKDFIDKLVA